MKQWEYVTIDFPISRLVEGVQLLSEYGKGGWELVAVTVETYTYAPTKHYLFLKREAQK